MQMEWTEPDEQLLARSVFGTDDLNLIHSMIGGWAIEQGLGPIRVAEIELSVGAAVTVLLPDQEKAFVKVWPGTSDLRSLMAQMDVQHGMRARGFPAPLLLAQPSALGPGWAVAMEYDRKGVPTDATRPAVRRAMATGLARFISEAESFRTLDGLPRRALPADGVIWPAPHNALFDWRGSSRESLMANGPFRF